MKTGIYYCHPKPVLVDRDGDGKCGPFCMLTILRTYVPTCKCKPDDLYINKKCREKDHTLPWHVSKLLRAHNLRAKTGIVLKTYFLETITEKIIENRRPIMVAIKSTREESELHWLLIVGFTHYESETLFHVYDPQYSGEKGRWGNAEFSSNKLLSAIPWWWFGTFIVEMY